MKMYRESLRKLAPVGIPLGILTLLYTVITGGQDCFGLYTISRATSAVGLTPVLVYYVFASALFALYGFSFLFKRAASDLYHSLPVPRRDLYLSVTLASASWIGATVVLNVLAMLLLLIGGCPFVPAYVPLCILFYFTASMLVYAAAAIGCALSGTLITALASAGVVLFLPRFVQFVIARGLVARVPIVGWLDLGALLNPMSNIATGLVVMQTRNMYITQIISLPYILYSLALTAVELVIGAWLFNRRSSEVADNGAGRKGWAIATGCLLSFTMLIVITVDSHRLLSVYGAALVALALLIYVIYQFVALRRLKQVLLSLPYFLLSAALAVAVWAGIDATVKSALDTAPTADQIASVSFRGYDAVQGGDEYSSILLRKIAFTDDDLKEYVADNLASAVDRLKNPDSTYSSYYSTYNQYQVIEPIVLKLTDGRTIRRTIEFANMDTLNELRGKNEDFQTAIHAFPAADGLQYLSLYGNFTAEEDQALWESYRSESIEKNLVPDDYYRTHAYYQSDDTYAYTRGDAQTLSSIAYSGYTGTERFNVYDSIRMETPKTLSLLMKTVNTYAEQDTAARFKEAVTRILSPLALENDSVSLSLQCYNVPIDSGEPVSLGISLYLDGYDDLSDGYTARYAEYAQRVAKLLQNAEFTDDPSGMFAYLNWSVYDATTLTYTNEPVAYLRFSDEDEATVVQMLTDWQTASMYGY